MLLFYLSFLDSAGDREKFTALYNTYKIYMLRLAMQYVHNYAIAEEVVHDAFVDLAKYFDKIGDIDSVDTKKYITVVTKTCAYKAYKQEKRNRSTLYDDTDEDTNGEAMPSGVGYEQLAVHENAEYILSLIERLDEISALTLSLRYYYDYDYRHIARLTGEKETTARKRVERAVNRLKKMAEEDF